MNKKCRDEPTIIRTARSTINERTLADPEAKSIRIERGVNYRRIAAAIILIITIMAELTITGRITGLELEAGLKCELETALNGSIVIIRTEAGLDRDTGWFNFRFILF